MDMGVIMLHTMIGQETMFTYSTHVVEDGLAIFGSSKPT